MSQSVYTRGTQRADIPVRCNHFSFVYTVAFGQSLWLCCSGYILIYWAIDPLDLNTFCSWCYFICIFGGFVYICMFVKKAALYSKVASKTC